MLCEWANDGPANNVSKASAFSDFFIQLLLWLNLPMLLSRSSDGRWILADDDKIRTGFASAIIFAFRILKADLRFFDKRYLRRRDSANCDSRSHCMSR